MKVLLLCIFGLSLAVEKNEQNYEGPVVYSNLPPPVLFFPNFPAQQQKTVGEGKRIEYAPLPYNDLPLLVYQSEDQPPVHVVEKLSNDARQGPHPDLKNQQFISIGLALQHLPQSVATDNSRAPLYPPVMNQQLNARQKTTRGKGATPPIFDVATHLHKNLPISRTKLYQATQHNDEGAKHQVTQPGEEDRQSMNEAQQLLIHLRQAENSMSKVQQLRQVENLMNKVQQELQTEASFNQSKTHLKKQEGSKSSVESKHLLPTSAPHSPRTELKTLSRQMLQHYKTIADLQKNTDFNEHHLISIGVYPLNIPEGVSQIRNGSPGIEGRNRRKPAVVHQEVNPVKPSGDLKKSPGDAKTVPGEKYAKEQQQLFQKTKDDHRTTPSTSNSREQYQQIIIHVPHMIAGEPQISILQDGHKPPLSLGTQQLKHHTLLESVKNVANSLPGPFRVTPHASASSLHAIHFPEFLVGRQPHTSFGNPTLYVQRQQNPQYYEPAHSKPSTLPLIPFNFIHSPRRRSSPDFMLSNYAEIINNYKYNEWLLSKIARNALKMNSLDAPLKFTVGDELLNDAKSSQENIPPPKKKPDIFMNSEKKPPIIVYKGCRPPIEIYGSQRDVRNDPSRIPLQIEKM